MTVKTLKALVRGFLNEKDEKIFEEEYGDRFLESANSGLSDLATTVFPKRRTVKINHRPLPNTASVTAFKKGRESVTVTASGGVALSFFCDGNGKAEIFTEGKKEGEIELLSSSEPVFYTYKIKGKGEVELLFSGEFGFSVSDLGVFPYLYGKNEIPKAGKKREYELTALAPDFLSFDNFHPVLLDGELSATENYAILEENKIVLLREGLYSVPYLAFPVFLTPSSSDEDVIDLPERGARLLALFIASELYADYDREQSRLYRNDYYQGKSESFTEPDYRYNWALTTGWL